MPLSINPIFILRIKTMSACATYEFNKANFHIPDLTICFYIHHNGSPKRAAEYFYIMHYAQCPDQYQDYASQFFRVNVEAEFTKGRDEYSDTEYHYIFSQNEILSAFERQANQCWVLIYEGDWLTFVNKYQKQSRKLYRFNTSFNFPTTHTMTLKEMRAMLESKKEEARTLEEDGKIEQAAMLRDDTGYLKAQLKIIEDKIEND